MQIQHWYIGIDVSKGYGDFLMLDENRSTIDKAYKLPDSPGGHEKLLKKIQILLDTSEDVRIQVGVESTGGYENHWCQLLRNYSDRLTVYRINPRAINAFSKGQMTRNGTDSISANLIANYMISHPQKLKDFQLQKVRHEDFFKGKKHLHFINLLIKQETQMRNAFEKVLFEYYPSFLALNKRKAPMYLLHLLSNHPDPKKILNLDESVLCEIPGVTKERLIQLRAARELQHIANQPDFDLIQVSAQQILHQNRLIALQKRQLATKYKNLSGVDLLVSIPGVGIDSAINLILEIGDIKRFETKRRWQYKSAT